MAGGMRASTGMRSDRLGGSARKRQPRAAVVTGAAGGIGGAVVRHLRGAGWHVIATDKNRMRAPAGMEFEQADLASRSEVMELLDRLLRSLRSLDLLVNCAAEQVCAPAAGFEAEAWDRAFAVNVTAPFLLARGLLPLLRRGGGAIVNVSSVHAVATSPGMVAYVTTKGALSAMTRALALEFATDGVRVNAIQPGAVDTPMLRAGLRRSGKAELPGRLVAGIAARSPLRRVGRPREIAEAVEFLADSGRASFITGASLTVDGGVLARLSSE